MNEWRETEIGLIPKDWSYLPLGEILSESTRNGIYKSTEYHGRGIRVVNMGEIFAFDRLPSIEMSRIELTEEELRKSSVNENDLLFARRSLVAEGAGKCTLILHQNEPLTFESSIIRVRPNQEKADSRYLFYLFKSKTGKYLLKTILRQVAVSGITGTDLVKLKIPLPLPKEQKQIADVLSCLDNKIDNLHRQNETLEKIAQTLFKHWFIDFEFPNDDGKPYKSAGGAMVASELGDIPAGWRIGKLGDIGKIITGKTPSTHNSELWGNDLCFITPTDFKNYKKYILNAERSISKSAISQFKQYIIPENSIVVTCIGSDMGKVAKTGVTCITNQQINSIIPFTNFYFHEYIYFFLKKQYKLLRTIALGGSTMPIINKSAFSGLNIVLPNYSILGHFGAITNSLSNKIINNEKEIQTLTTTRDTLLPKLMSGQIRVKQIESLIEEVK